MHVRNAKNGTITTLYERSLKRFEYFTRRLVNEMHYRRTPVWILRPACVLFAAFILLASSSFAAAGAEKRILLLHSFHQGYEWTDSLHQGVVEELQNSGDKDIELFVEYLDCIRNPGPAHEKMMAELFRRRYADRGVLFDAIICTDDDALVFLRERGESIFGNVPKVFCGINDFTPEHIKGMTNVTGVNESISVGETIEAALNLHRSTKTIAVVSGSRRTEKRNLELVRQSAPSFSDAVQFIWLDELEPHALQKRLGELNPESSAVLMLAYLLTPSGQALTVRENMELITEATSVPVFGCWDFLLPHGAVGGKVVHGHSQGAAAASLALRILAGERADSIPIVLESPNRYVFNAAMLQKFAIPEALLPPDSQIVYRTAASLLSNWETLSRRLFFAYDLFAENTTPMLLIDPDTGIILDGNHSARGFYGYPELKGMNIAQINMLSPEEVSREMERARSRNNTSFDFKHRLADGSVRDVGVHSSPVFIDGREILLSLVIDETERVTAQEALGQRNRWIVALVVSALLLQSVVLLQLLRSAAQRKKAEKALRESERKLSALFASMTEVVALHDLVFDEEGRPANYRITGCNAAFTKSIGIPEEAAVGRLATEVYGTEKAPYLQEYGKVAMTGEPSTFETYFAPLDKHFFISVVSPGENSFATVTTDITSIKKAEQLIEAKNKELEQVVYVASHDLRSPLVNVDGYSRELEYSVEDLLRALDDESLAPPERERAIRALLPDMTDSLRRIRGSAKQMDALLRGLLKLSRLGRAALSVGSVDMNELMAELSSSLQFQVREAGAALRVGRLPSCRGDAVQLTQVFANLLGNALKYLDPQRPGEIVVEGRIEQDRAVYLVRDNGIGIAPQHQEKIFQLFHRLNPSANEGEGLGLTIVRQILGRLDGEVVVESTPGTGSTFTITLPAASKKGE